MSASRTATKSVSTSPAEKYPEVPADERAFLRKEYRGQVCGKVMAAGYCDRQNPAFCCGKSCGDNNPEVRTTQAVLSSISVGTMLVGLVFHAIWIGEKSDGTDLVPIITTGEGEFTKSFVYFLLPKLVAWVLFIAYYIVQAYGGHYILHGIQIGLSGLGLVSMMALCTASLDTLTVAIASGGDMACLTGILLCYLVKDNLEPVVEVERTAEEYEAALKARKAQLGFGGVRMVFHE